MRISKILPVLAAFLFAVLASFLAATLAVGVIERNSERGVHLALEGSGNGWAKVQVDGLQVVLSGTAPNEATRFRALSVAGKIVDSARVIDAMEVEDPAAIAPPRFSIEILRNDEGISLIGLIPASEDRAAIVQAAQDASGDMNVTDLLQTADFPAPARWSEALDYGLAALELLPRSKISIAADMVAVTAITESVAAKRKLESTLARRAPDGMRTAVSISAPRPVITPFTLRFLIDEGGARFDACSADDAESLAQITRAATAAGLSGKTNCTIGLGVPSPHWGAAVEVGIEKLAEMGGGSITYSDADVTLVALDTVEQADFDRIVGELETALPDVFSLHSVLPEPEQIDGTGEGEGPPEFVAIRSPEGQIQLRGRITDDRARMAAESFAHAYFGSANVYAAMRLDESLPEGWPVRVIAALEALSLLNSGSAIAQPELVVVRGVTGDADANAEISRILSDKLGEAENFKVEVSYEEKLDPELALPSPEDCVQQINDIIAVNKIVFAPGSTELDAAGLATVDQIAEVMKECRDVPMEIGGHTDSQGREEMNAQLSQARADSVLNALLARRVLTSGLTSKGYGETVPIGDNETEEGRETNRRIEFRLLLPAAPAQDAAPEDGAADIQAADGETGAEAAAGSASDSTSAGEETLSETSESEAPNEQN